MPDSHIPRRRFLQSVALGGNALTIASSSTLHAAGQGEKSAPQSPSELGVLQRPAVEIPIIEKVDVCVCGAGPAGVSAAIAAARQGAVTRLVDVNGCAGGIWTARLLCWFQGHKHKTGFINELRTALLERGVAWDEQKSGFAGEVDEMQVLLEELCGAAGVKMLYHTRVVEGYPLLWQYCSEAGYRCGYVVYQRSGNGEQFFNLKDDPGETKNLIGHADFADAIARHRDLLRSWCRRTNDDFKVPRAREAQQCRDYLQRCAE